MAEKEIVRTERAPAPFEGAPYNQAVKVGGLVFVAGQLGLAPDGSGMVGGGVAEQTEQALQNLSAILEEAGSSLDKLAKTTVFLQNLDDFAAMNEVYARMSATARPPGRRSKWPSSRRARSSRSRRSPTSDQNVPVWDSVADYVHSLGLDAYVVGGAVRDQLLGIPVKDLDFVVPGVGHAELRAALEPHGKVEDLVVADQRVGVRLLPRDKAVRALQPGGIEFAPPRVERSTGPGRHDFEIVADAGISLEQDMERRDFTINAIARRLETGEVLDPLGGRADLERRILRTTSPTSFRDDPLRIVRGLRFVSQLDVDPDEDTLRQMREWAPQIDHVSGERIGGGLAADGMGELSKLLMGAKPAKALRLARDAGVLVHLLPEMEPAIGFDQESRYHDLPLDEHTFEVVQAAADAGAPLRVRLAALLHDLGKPQSAWRGQRRSPALLRQAEAGQARP